MSATELTENESAVRERLRWDIELFGPHCLTIVTKAGLVVPYQPSPEQLRFHRLIRRQRELGIPPRIVSLKARQIGISTATQAEGIQQTTQRPNQRGFVLAHDNRTAGPLFEIGKRMWASIPDEADLRPKITGRRKQRLLEFDNGSSYESDTAREFEAGRGLTLRFLHLSEPAFYPDAQRKMTGLLQAVPYDPWTLVVAESTANGQNYFKDLWDLAESGDSEWVGFFSPWYREASYRRAFANEGEREDFEGTLGDGTIGEDEIDLVSVMESEDYDHLRILEHLHWRRWAISNNFAGDLDRFRQEFPSTPLEAFMTTGRHVFTVGDVRRMHARVRETPEPTTGHLEITGKPVERLSRGVTVHVPRAVEWLEGPVHDDRRPGWRVWERPVPKSDDTPEGQYVIGVDASGGDEKEGASAYHVIDVIDHRTRRQVAEYRSRIDPDELALEIYKAALYWNRPWVAVEITGSWGGPAVRRLWRDYRYPFVYKRQAPESAKERTEDRLGWHTGFAEKKLLIAELREMLRNGEDGVRSRGLADEFGWYVLDDRNRAKPEFGKTSDRLMAHGIAVCVAREKPLRPDRKRGDVTSTIAGSELSKSGWF